MSAAADLQKAKTAQIILATLLPSAARDVQLCCICELALKLWLQQGDPGRGLGLAEWRQHIGTGV